jgi:hypothetical protein
VKIHDSFCHAWYEFVCLTTASSDNTKLDLAASACYA